MSLKAVSFDFWNTLVDGAATPERTARRLARLHEALTGAGHQTTVDAIATASRRAFRRVSEGSRAAFREVGPAARWAVVAEELGIGGTIPFEVVESVYEDLSLQPPPPLLPGVADAVRTLHENGYRLAVVCNTGMAGGRVLRQVLAEHALLPCFRTTLWSDEVGWGKPNPHVFRLALAELGNLQPHETLHVGDLEELDVVGARGVGMWSALYAPAAESPRTAADLVVADWSDFPAQIAGFQPSR